MTSARNVFKPDLERCKRESQEAQQLCGGLGNSVGNKLGNKKLLGNKGEGEQGPTVATQQDALSPIVDALQVFLVLVCKVNILCKLNITQMTMTMTPMTVPKSKSQLKLGNL